MAARQRVEFSRVSRASIAVALALILGVVYCCGGREEEPKKAATPEALAAQADSPSTPARRGSSAPAVTTTEELTLESTEFGALHGRILFTGKVPERFELGATSNAECKHHPAVDQRSNREIVNDGKLANAFVTLTSGVDSARVPPVSASVVTLDQKGCMYVPRVLGMRVGQVLRVTNEDPTTHNVHIRSKRNAELNRNMGASQPALEFRFERAERPIPFSCDIHPWMGAAVFVEEHPWFAVSDEAGAFSIVDVPPGTYEVQAQHETLGKVSGTVSVTAGKSTGFTLTLAK